jgi:DNA-binding GntR family transcriptional regulator
MSTARQADTHPSLGEQVYGLIRQDIMTCALPPGSSFSEGILSDRYGVSKAPVRWALAALSRDSLVIASPRQGYTVVPVTVQSVRELFELRVILESASARLAAGRADIEKLKAIDAIVHKGYSAGDKRSQNRWLQANKDFHVEIARAAGNVRLLKMVNSTLEESERIFYLQASIPNSTKPMGQDHQDLIKALAKCDGALSEQIAGRHVERSRDVVVKSILESAVIQQASIAMY